MPEIDLSGFENITVSSFRNPDPGEYSLRITEPPTQEFKDDKSFMDINFEVVSGPAQKDPLESGTNDPVGMKCRDRIFLSPQSQWRFKRLLVSGGLLARDDKASPMAKGKIQTEALAGTVVRARLTPRLFEGKEYRNYDYII